jgi:hypothetical protein
MHLPPSKSQECESVDKIRPKKGGVILQPVTMRIPNRYSIYSPSRLKPKIAVSYEEFLSQYAKYPRGIHICFDVIPTPDAILQRTKLITAYGFGLDCWYIVAAYYDIENSPSKR